MTHTRPPVASDFRYVSICKFSQTRVSIGDCIMQLPDRPMRRITILTFIGKSVLADGVIARHLDELVEDGSVGKFGCGYCVAPHASSSVSFCINKAASSARRRVSCENYIDSAGKQGQAYTRSHSVGVPKFSSP